MVSDPTRRSAFIEENLGLVHSCAGRFRNRGLEYDDLYSAGCMGLIKAYDGFDETERTEFPTMLEETAKIEDWIRANCGGHIRAAYGCSLGGACLTRFLALGKIPVNRAIIDAGITPYQMPFVLRRLACLRDFLGFRLVTKTAKFWKQPIRRIVGRCRGVIPRRSTMRCRKSRCRRAAASRTGTVKRRKRRGAAI